MCFKKNSLRAAYQNGLRRCPCCNVQLVWKANPINVQKNLATVDHMVAKSLGGPDTSDNMFVMCRKCNEERGNQCFVEFVSSRGVSKIEAEGLYKNAHLASVRHLIDMLMNQARNPAERKGFKNRVRSVVINYRKYFKDYLPEFDLLPREVCK
jgi:hypothetical protein